jgi:hypothetical protein
MSACDYVMLKGGLTIPLAVLRVLWDLEERGVRVRVDDEGDLVVAPRGVITDTDREVLRRWKPHVAVLVTYEATVQ